MNRIGVRELQQNASAAVRRASRGERIEVTDRGRPVAVLAPLAEGSMIDTLEAAGRLVKAEGDLLDLVRRFGFPLEWRGPRAGWRGCGPQNAELRSLVVYLDSSALVKLVVLEPESRALHGYLSLGFPVVAPA
jgi:prevent-host-death family protein